MKGVAGMERLAQPSAGADRIGAIGICGGGAYTINAAITDHRMRHVIDYLPGSVETGRSPLRRVEGDAWFLLVNEQRSEVCSRASSLLREAVPTHMAGADLVRAGRRFRRDSRMRSAPTGCPTPSPL